MLDNRKTQFAIRKLTTGAGILLLSIGLGTNLSSKKVSASEIDSAQTVQSETPVETETEEVEVPATEEITETEVPKDSLTTESTEGTESATETKTPVLENSAPELTDIEPTTDATNSADVVQPENNTSAPQPETEKVESTDNSETVKNETEENPVENKPTALPDKMEVETEEKDENPDDAGIALLPDEVEVETEEKDETSIDAGISLLPDAIEILEKENNKGIISDAIIEAVDKWLQKYRPTWDDIANKNDFPGWENVFNENIEFKRDEPFDPWDPHWQATVNKNITITQTVNGITQTIQINYDVAINIKPELLGGFWWTKKFIITEVKVNKDSIKYKDNKNEFDAVEIPPAEDGFENKVTGTINGVDRPDLGTDVNGNQIQTNLTGVLNDILQKGQNVTFEYNINQIASKKPTWADVVGDNKNEWNDLFQDAKFEETTDGNWTATATLNKDIIQNINGLDGENKQTITFKKDVTIIIRRHENTNSFKIVAVNQSNWKPNGSGSFDPVNISKPGYNHDISATITENNSSSNFSDFTTENDELSTNLGSINLENNKNSITINYQITYSPDWNKVDWPEDLKPDDFTQNENGVWTAEKVTEKEINQVVNNGNSNLIKLSQSTFFELAWIDGNWKLTERKGDIIVTPNSTINIAKPGYNHSVSATIGNQEFKSFDVNDGNIIITDPKSLIDLPNNSTITYQVEYSPNWNDVIFPEGFKPDDFTQNDNGSWSANQTTKKEINQTVNGKDANSIQLTHSLTYTLTWENNQWNLSKDTTITLTPGLTINIAKPGHIIGNVTADNGFNGFTTDKVAGNIIINDSPEDLQKLMGLDKINYIVNYTLDWSKVELPEGINKDDIKDLIEQPNGSWSGTTTINKVINQIITNSGSSNQLNLSQNAIITFTFDEQDGKWKVVELVPQGDISIKESNGILNVHKPGYTHNVTTDIDLDITTDEAGNIIITNSQDNLQKLMNLTNGSTINYQINYTPTSPSSSGAIVTPDKDNTDIWADADNVTDKEKDDIIDKIQNGDLTWTDNRDGTWSASVDFKKEFSQIISGNVIGNTTTKIDATKTVTLTAQLKGDKFHITDIKSDKWTSQSDLGQELPKPDNKYEVSIEVNGTTHENLQNYVTNNNKIPGLDSELIQNIINDSVYGTPIQLNYVINANNDSTNPDAPLNPDNPSNPGTGGSSSDSNTPGTGGSGSGSNTPESGGPGSDSNTPGTGGSDSGSTTPGTGNIDSNTPAKPDTPNVDPDMGVTPDTDAGSTENTMPHPEASPDQDATTTPEEEATRPLPEDVIGSENENSTQAGNAQDGTATGKKAIIPLSESTNTSTSDANSTNAAEAEATLPQTGEGNDKLHTMGMIMAGLATAITTLGMAIKKKKN